LIYRNPLKAQSNYYCARILSIFLLFSSSLFYRNPAQFTRCSAAASSRFPAAYSFDPSIIERQALENFHLERESRSSSDSRGEMIRRDTIGRCDYVRAILNNGSRANRSSLAKSADL